MRRNSIVVILMTNLICIMLSTSILNDSFAQENKTDLCLELSGKWNDTNSRCENFENVHQRLMYNSIDKCAEYSGEWNNVRGMCENFKDKEQANKFVDLLCDASEDYEGNKAICDEYYNMIEGHN